MKKSLSRNGTSATGLFEGLENRMMFAFGAADTNFGTAGRAIVGFSGTNATPAIQELLVVSGGKILAGGTTGLARFTSAGAIDSTFGSSGKVTFNAAATFVADAVDPTTNNIYVLVTAASGTGIFRYTANGKVDTTYASGGTATLTTSKTFIPQAMTVQSDGKVIVAGVFKTDSSNGRKVRVYRLKTDGTTDTSFGSSGALEFNFGQSSFLANTIYDQVAAVRIVAGGKIDIIGGSIDYTPAGTDPDTGNFTDASYDKAIFAVARLTTAGRWIAAMSRAESLVTITPPPTRSASWASTTCFPWRRPRAAMIQRSSPADPVEPRSPSSTPPDRSSTQPAAIPRLAIRSR